ncbi:anti-sigma factor family protein [Moorella sp. ACPs]|uniref:anti-sigma factor family protein n=1 Tax=Neomoorella carbonis TaxID=3062783 RepID=UPI003256379E
MNCSHYRELLSSYLDDVLTATQRRDVEKHLRRCNSCREELEALRQTVNLLRAWSEEELELPAGFEERLRSRLEAACRPWYRRLPQWLSLAAAAAVTVVVAIAGSAGYFPFPPPFQARQVTSAFTQEEQGQVKALPAPTTTAPKRDFSMIITDQENKPPAPAITPSGEEARPAQPLRRQPAKATKPQPVFNSGKRNPVVQAMTNVGSRGQNPGPASEQNHQAGKGQKLPGEQITGLQDQTSLEQIISGDNKLQINKDKGEITATGKQTGTGTISPPPTPPDNQTGEKKLAIPDARMLSPNKIDSADIYQTLTVPEKVYKKPAPTPVPEASSRPPSP